MKHDFYKNRSAPVDPDSSTSLYAALIGVYRPLPEGCHERSFRSGRPPGGSGGVGTSGPEERRRRRLRLPLPETITGRDRRDATRGHGMGCRRRLPRKVRFQARARDPLPTRIPIKIPDATPEIVSAYALSDVQALLARIRYNRMIDIFPGVAAFSLQNHLRTTVRDIGQIEIDKICVGVDSRGCQYVVPVQAKGGTDRISRVQTRQDIRCCLEKFLDLVCRSVSIQFMHDDLIAMFELTMVGDEVKIVAEQHCRLVQADRITPDDLKSYSIRTWRAAFAAPDRSARSPPLQPPGTRTAEGAVLYL